MEKILPITAFIAICLFIVKELLEWRRRVKGKKNDIKALKTLIYEEVNSNYRNFLAVDCLAKIILEDKLTNIQYKTMVNIPYIDYSIEGKESVLVPLKAHSTKVMDNYLLDVSKLDRELIKLLMGVRKSAYNYNEAFLLGFNDFLSKNPSTIAIKRYLKMIENFHESYKNDCTTILNYCSEVKVKTNVN